MATETRADDPSAAQQIEVSPEMIMAGCDELRLVQQYAPSADIVSAVYRAMEAARRSACFELP